MTAASVTGIGQGASNKESPPNVKFSNLTGPFGPRILMSGVATMSGGEVTITHPELPDWDSDKVIRFAVSNSAYSVFVESFNSTIFVVRSLEEESSFSFYWMIVSVGISDNLEVD
jgi:hypothetical protein